ncbi:MAG TPA: hypothetical protein VLE22_07845 [Bryobacteraceae bacterium]|jgi:hypothetical protein|nr:hypothetical protein [Bryobacteraceae bacterium]
MGKFKLAGRKKKSQKPGGAIPCIALIVIGIVLLSLLFYAILKSG